MFSFVRKISNQHKKALIIALILVLSLTLPLVASAQQAAGCKAELTLLLAACSL